MPIFLERFVVPLCVAVVMILVINQLKLDGAQRWSLFIVTVALAYFASHTVYLWRQPAQTPPAAAVAPESPSPSTAPSPAPPKHDAPAPAGEERVVPDNKRPHQTIGKVTQRSSGPNSPNIATFGPNSPVTVNQARPPWMLSEDQSRAFAEAVRPYRDLWDGQFDVVICVWGDPDSTRMAESFVSSFRAAGWALPHAGYAQGAFAPAPVGVGMQIGGTELPTGRLLQFLNVVSNRLRAIGVIDDQLDVNLNKDAPVGRFIVQVGRRPDH